MKRRVLGLSLWQWIVAAATVIILLVIPGVAGVYQTQLLTYGLIFAIAALGFNLLLGYTGLLSFGHSAYFGAGAYGVAFMAKYWSVGSMELYIVGGVIITAAVSALFGAICVRHTRIFFAILTLALSQVLWTLAYKFFWITGGTDGLRVPFSKMTLLGGLIDFTDGGSYVKFVHAYYYYVLAIFCICVAVMWLIVHSPFGKTLQAIRDNETRARFLGVAILRYRWLAFLVSGMFTGLAGVLWVPLNGLTTPDILYWPMSGKIVFFTVLGGFRNFTGPIVGAVGYNYLEVFAVAKTEYWQFLLGSVLIALVLFMPGGVVGALTRMVDKLKTGLESREDETETPRRKQAQPGD
jgi:branched-chain amino acid transport system permease protein